MQSMGVMWVVHDLCADVVDNDCSDFRKDKRFDWEFVL